MSFLTGSRVYGTPREDSDIDLVVLVSHAEIDLLHKLSENSTDIKVCTSDIEHGLSSGSFKFGQINLIAVTKKEHYEIWKRGTEDLCKIAGERGSPITREEACKHFKELRDGAKKHGADLSKVQTTLQTGVQTFLSLSKM